MQNLTNGLKNYKGKLNELKKENLELTDYIKELEEKIKNMKIQ